jgi:ChrB-like protein
MEADQKHNAKGNRKNKERTKMTDTSWLVFFPQTPATPSSLRVLVWRRLQQAGALNLQGGAWMLPRTKEQERVLQTLLTEMEQQGGSGFFLEARAPSHVIQAELIDRFQAERAKEYQEFGERCQQFLQEIEKETHAHKFTFAELEENEQDLLKLTRWVRKIGQRDFFPNAKSLQAQEHMSQCRQALQTFTTSVYEQEGLPLPNAGDGAQIGSAQGEGEEGET